MLLRRHGRRLGAALVALTVVLVVAAARAHPASIPGRPVVVSALALRSGTRLRADDLRLVTLPAADVPRHAVTTTGQAVGRRLAGPVDAGEPLTAARLAPAPRLPPGTVLAPIRLADPAVTGLITPGQRVTLLAGAVVVAGDVPVLATPSGGLLLVAVTPAQGRRLAAASAISADLLEP